MTADTITAPVQTVERGLSCSRSDVLAIEEPLQFCLNRSPLSNTMRSPGSDLDLATGFLLTEEIVDDVGQILSITQGGIMEPTTAARPLAHGVVQQDGMTIEELLSKYSGAMYRAALHKLGSAEDAEDALQDALLSASRNLGQFKGECHISTWLVAIAINAARMHLRRGMRHRGLSLDERTYDGTSRVVPEPADRRANPEQVYRKTELHGIVSHVAKQLSPSLRNAFRLRVFEGFSIRETAQALGVTEGTVKAQFFRARARMNTLMSQSLGVHGRGRRRTRRDSGREFIGKMPARRAPRSERAVAIEA